MMSYLPALGRAGNKNFMWGINMKTQIKFQKILTLVSLIIAALTFVFALVFLSGNLSDLYGYFGKNWSGIYKYDGADEFLYAAQDFVSVLIILSIVYIVAVVTLYIASTNKRRNYYITNYISIGLTIAMATVVAIFGIIFMSVLVAKFYAIDWDYLNDFIEKMRSKGRELNDVSQSPYMFIIGYVVFLLALADALAWVYNLVWKIKLMKGEKELLANGLVKEVA
jgi:MFS family permease